MATEVKLPRLGQGMESGVIVRWLKAEGDTVASGEPLYELDTDKVTQEVEADVDGVLLQIVVPEGEVEVGSTVAVIGEDGESAGSAKQDAPAEESEPASGNGAGAEPAASAPAEEADDEAEPEQQEEAPAERSEPAAGEPAAAGQEGVRI